MNDLSTTELMKETPLSAPIHPLIAQRWSPRAFIAGRAVPPATLKSVIEAGRWAPSCFGAEPWRFIVCDRHRDEIAWKKVFAALAPGNQAWTETVPVFVLVCADTRFTHDNTENRWGAYDSGAAAMNIAIQAVAEGLATHSMGGFEIAKLRASFNVPERFVPMAVMAIGYQARADVLSGDIAVREVAPRTRRPLSETYFLGRWGTPDEAAK